MPIETPPIADPSRTSLCAIVFALSERVALCNRVSGEMPLFGSIFIKIRGL